MAGYIGTTPVPQATQHRESFTATGGQTSFATAGYTPQFIDVYLNGVKLAPADFTATNGSDVVLASGATASDILETVAYTPFEVANQTFTGTTTAANLTVTGAFTSQGIDDNANATAITIDSSENVGIGTSSPSSPLAVETGGIASLSSYAGHIVVGPSSRTSSSGDYSGGILFDQANGVQASGKKGASIVGFQDGSDVNSMGLTFNVHGTDGSANREEAMRIDSSGNVGIGTSAPVRSLSLFGTLPAVSFHTSTSGSTSSDGFQIQANSTDVYLWNYENTPVRFATNGSERMRLDASGNLLVGTTDTQPPTNNDASGIALRTDGKVAASRSNGISGDFNNGSNGDILWFRKAGTVMGALGSSTNTEITLAGQDAGIGIIDHAVVPTQGDGVLYRNDNEVDLGRSDTRFKDLYLSGGVYLGGTGSANKLDDYEEGTWTLGVTIGGSAQTLSGPVATYTKIGNTVSIRLRVSFNKSGSGAVNITGLPFASAAGATVSVPIGCQVGSVTSTAGLFANIDNSTTIVHLADQAGDLTDADLASTAVIFSSFTYQA